MAHKFVVCKLVYHAIFFYFCRGLTIFTMKTRILLLCFALTQAVRSSAEDFFVTSPDGSLKVTVSLSDEGRLSYSVSRDGRAIVDESPLGLKTSVIDFTEGVELVESENGSVDDSYTLPVGKRSQYRDHAGTLSVLTKKGT